jgi:adenylate cyclase class IV
MPFEIELKARLDDFTPLKERLSAKGTYLRSYKKSDSYWYPGQNTSFPSGIRVRREYNTIADGTAIESVLVTYKTKEITDSIEINDEREFTISNASLFEELLTRLGLYRDI